jgi:hypothetical protein
MFIDMVLTSGQISLLLATFISRIAPLRARAPFELKKREDLTFSLFAFLII